MGKDGGRSILSRFFLRRMVWAMMEERRAGGVHFWVAAAAELALVRSTVAAAATTPSVGMSNLGREARRLSAARW